ncbi:AAA family ATPase [Ornithinibacillus gellani]|uniref:AAA family ATPase n=1 Tax=Ornithinibacillus gellani TaxID=2293253 RepID=UPI001CC2018F
MDYLFGETHNAKSCALGLLEREINIILLDEFDKTFDTVYSAFYQMFDEGIFKDRNFNVNLEDAIIICTSNYSNKNGYHWSASVL